MLRLLLGALIALFPSLGFAQGVYFGGGYAVPVLNVPYGADPTGVKDSTLAINNAANSGGTVYLPAGVYHVTDSINIGNTLTSQCLVGDGWGTIIDVSTDFNPAALGVVRILTPNTANSLKRPCVKNVQFRFHQPQDATAVTSQASASGNTITLASVPAGVTTGTIVYDATANGRIPSFLSAAGGVQAITTVTGIAGNVLTLSQSVTSVASGDTINFAQPRGSFTTLSVGCSLTAGAPGCKYPWAIYNNVASGADFENILIAGAWDGIWQHSSTFRVENVYVMALDTGLDIDNCHNFPQISDYEMWNFGTNAKFTQDFQNGGPAFDQVFYDGNTNCANIGATDGLAGASLQCWTGKLNLTSTWSWGAFSYIELDGTNANFSNAGTASGFTQIANFYSSKGGQQTTTPIQVSSGNVSISNIHTTQSAKSGVWSGGAANISVTGGRLAIAGGYIWAGNTATVNDTSVSGGVLEISHTEFDMGSGCGALGNAGYISQSSTGVLRMDNNWFSKSCVSLGAGKGITFGSDNTGNWVRNTSSWGAGWTVVGPSGTFPSGPVGGYVGSPSQADRNITGSSDQMLVTDQTLRLNNSSGVTEALVGCSSNNDGQVVVLYDASGNAAYVHHVLTPNGGTIMGASSAYMSTPTAVLYCIGALTDWRIR